MAIDSRLRFALRLSVIAIVIAALGIAVFVIRFDANRYKGELVELVRSQTGWTLSIDGEVGLSIWPQLSLSIGKAGIAAPAQTGLTARFDSGQFTVTLLPLLSGQLVVEGIVLKGLSLAPRPGEDWLLEKAEVRTGRIAASESDRASLQGRLRSRVHGTDLSVNLQTDYRIGPDTARLTLERFEASANGTAQGLAGLRGRVAGNGSLDTRSGDAVAERLELTLAIEQGPVLSLEGKGRLWMEQQRAELAMEGRLDDAPVIVSASAATFSPLSLRYQLDLYQLDFDSLGESIRTARARAVKPAPTALSGQAATEPGAKGAGQLASVGVIDGSGTIRIGRLRAAGVWIERIDATLRTGGNRIQIAPLSARLFGGTLESQVVLDPDAHRLTAAIRNIEAAGLLRTVAGREPLDGRGNLDLELRASGLDADAVLSSLSGSAAFSLRDGAIRGIDLDRLLTRIRAALSGQMALADRPQAGERSNFESLSGSFSIRDGIATTADTEFRSGWLRGAASGRLDLPARSLDWTLRASVLPVPAAESRTAPNPGDRRETLARLQGMTIPIRISGPFDDLSYRVDLSQLAAEFARRELQRESADRLRRERQASEGRELLERLKDAIRR